MTYISTHIISVYQLYDVYGYKYWWYVDDGFGNLTAVSYGAYKAAEYSMLNVYYGDI